MIGGIGISGLAPAHGIGVSHRVLVSDCDILEDEAHAATVLRRQRGAFSAGKAWGQGRWLIPREDRHKTWERVKVRWKMK
jgi:hypothetical protein